MTRTTAERLGGVYAPLGLDLHAETPAEIVVSVLVQIFQVMRGAKGGHLGGPTPKPLDRSLPGASSEG